MFHFSVTSCLLNQVVKAGQKLVDERLQLNRVWKREVTAAVRAIGIEELVVAMIETERHRRASRGNALHLLHFFDAQLAQLINERAEAFLAEGKGLTEQRLTIVVDLKLNGIGGDRKRVGTVIIWGNRRVGMAVYHLRNLLPIDDRRFLSTGGKQS